MVMLICRHILKLNKAKKDLKEWLTFIIGELNCDYTIEQVFFNMFQWEEKNSFKEQAPNPSFLNNTDFSSWFEKFAENIIQKPYLFAASSDYLRRIMDRVISKNHDNSTNKNILLKEISEYSLRTLTEGLSDKRNFIFSTLGLITAILPIMLTLLKIIS